MKLGMKRTNETTAQFSLLRGKMNLKNVIACLGCAALALPLPAALNSASAATESHGAQSGADTAFRELQRLVDGGQFDLAYQLAKTLGSMQGDPHFDFLFGVAAVNAGRTPEGVLALERHLAVVPGNDRARLDLARGYFDLGDHLRAQKEFEFVLRYNPPKDVRANIERYLDAMQTRETLSSRNVSRHYLEIGVGRDSNVNAGTFNTQIDLPSGPVILADETSRERSSEVTVVAGGGHWVRRVTPPLAVFAGLDLDLKLNRNASEFDTGNVSGNLGFSVVSGPVLYRLTLGDSLMFVDDARYRNVLSGTGEIQYGLGKGLYLNGVLQYAEQTYRGEDSIRDSKSNTYGAGIQRTFDTAWRPLVGLQFSFIEEDNLNLRHDLSRDIESTRVFVGVSPTEKTALSLSVAEQRSFFQDKDIAFGTKRKDRLLMADVAVNYALSRNWLLRAEFQWSENDSNQDLYEFRRRLGLIKMRYLF